MPFKLTAYKIRSSTLFETIVALLILMISFSSGMVIYQKVMAGKPNAQHLSIGIVGDRMADSLQNVRDYSSRTLKINDFNADLNYHLHSEFPELRIMVLAFYNADGRVLWKTERLIPKAYDEN